MKSVLITAGANGIGLVMAQSFAAAGAQVWVTDVDATAIADLPAAIKGSCVSVADEGGMAALMADVQAAWGGLDVVCVNAGIKGPTSAIVDTDLGAWRDCLAVCLDGAFLTVKHAAPLMGQGGAMVFTASTAGLYGFPYRSPYAAAKWAIIGLMKTAAMELGPKGIRCNAIAPGSVEGPRIDRVFAAEAEAKGMTPEAVAAGYAAGTALGCLVTAQDVADMALFLASAPRISGQVIAVDGFTINPDPKV
ncbi:SDR family oxidoreductase [Pseudorhodobacter sp. E13]|uniref:SDR family oxidoreductase n=1 Tax=Pseudorhodobacter sp. E13 TaxID=2487931 RepID=UPI000F8F6A07|nr:SDR family oxidoreductase [Pseudorhodobacter sp. E13]RUS59405.1 SDR family oxidoreductase [Pseudorhodobacter sp. E13]